MRDPELWQRLSDYSFDTGTGSAPFSVKLARSQDWSAAFTARVIEEYRKFLYLSQVSGTQVTPSQTVDAAWHMHLTFTRDYWDDMCVNIIGAPVHHQPCAGEEEMPRYRDQFEQTRVLYEAEFEASPPGDVWGRDTAGERPLVSLMDETGSVSGVLVLVGLVGCIVLWLAAPDVHWIVYVLIMVAAFWLESLVEPKPRKRRRRRDDGGGYVDGDIDSNGSSGGSSGRGGSNDKQSSGRGFWNNDGDSDGGGCGGCGGD